MKQYKCTLIELGCEELPAFKQYSLITDWHDGVVTQLNKHRLAYGTINAWCGPRRLSLLIENLVTQGEAETIIKEGPARQVAYDSDGMPTAACIGFARSCGVEPNQLIIKNTKGGERVCYEQQLVGKKSSELLPQLLTEALQPLCKGMLWPQSSLPFLRPVRWLVLMVDKNTLDWQMFGLKSSNRTYGHRFLSTKPLVIDNAINYEKILHRNKVIANQQERVKMVESQARGVAQSAQLQLSPQLATEISGLVEYPTAYVGQFDKKFLQLPIEVLDSVICGTQKYMMLKDHKGNHLPSFVFIANIPSKKPQQLISGNEAVITPRLEDAVFFYQQDRKTDLAAKFDALAQVAFFSGLGSMQQKSLRCIELVGQLAHDLDLPQQPLTTAAQLCKCDLVSLMVQEFPHLQGIMGSYYYLKAKSRPDTNDRKCAAILRQHYLPRRASDPLPDSLEAISLSLVDKLDSLVGLFATNHKPSGTGDPYGLRRNGLAIGRILIEKALDLDIAQLLTATLGEYAKQGLLDMNEDQRRATITAAIEFIKERMLSYGNEQQLDTEILGAAFGADEKPGNIYRYWLRAQALKHTTPADLSQLIALNKRLRNIIGQNKHPLEDMHREYLKEKEEITLHKSYIKLVKQIEQSKKDLDYTNYAHLLVELAEPLALFFDKVMVMVDDPAIRSNRLSLLNSIHSLFSGLANLTVFSSQEH